MHPSKRRIPALVLASLTLVVALGNPSLAGEPAPIECSASPAPHEACEAAAGASSTALGAVSTAEAAARAAAREALLAPPVRVWTSLNMGPGSGLDADTLDGLEAEDFLAAIAAEAVARAAADAALAAADAALDLRVSRLEVSTPWVDVRAHGAVGDGVADDTAALQAAIDSASAGATVYFADPSAHYRVAGTLRVPRAMTLLGHGAEVRETLAGTTLLSIEASDVTVRGLRLVGLQHETERWPEHAIVARAASAAAPFEGIAIEGNEIRSWGFYGVLLEHVRSFRVADNAIDGVNYAGVAVLSGAHGVIAGNRIRDLPGAPNAYGVTLSRHETDSLVTDPRSSDVTVAGNVVEDVPNWKAFDTHGGERVSFVGNVARRVKMGIGVGSADGAGQIAKFAPLDVTLVGNVLVSGVTDGSAGFGIHVTGAHGVLGAPVERATAVIADNVVKGFGDAKNTISGALYLHSTRGLVVTGNAILEPSPTGINLYHDNDGAVVTGNTVVDAWTDSVSSGQGVGIYLRADYNTAVIAGNQVVRGERSATWVNTFGIRISQGAGQSATIGLNHVEASSGEVYDPGSHAKTSFGNGVDVSLSSNTRPALSLVNTGGSGPGLTVRAGSGSADYLVLDAGRRDGTSYLAVRGDGDVGVNAAHPEARLHVVQSSNTEPAALFVNGGGSGDGVRIRAGAAGPDYAVLDAARYDGVSYLHVRGDGRVGIGTTTPTARLAVAGDVKASGSITANAAASSGDVAEPVAGAGLEPGVVVVLDGYSPEGKLRVAPSTSPLDRRVAGVVSTEPSLRLAGLATDAPLAVTGVVPVRVVGPIAVGDLLVTSAVPGRAQACPELAACLGAILGKATEAHPGPGAGVVRALVTLA